jgi:serine/threonine protein kinase
MGIQQLDEEAIFNLARKIASPPVREGYLQQVCGENEALRARVQALLNIHEEERSLPERAAAQGPTVDEPINEGPGTVIGPYKLLEQIGEGGFGLVFMAEQQQPIRRKVAVKVLKPGMDTRQVIARFEAERQALALMDHPNIARVLDAGQTTSGRPYFVMELVRGVPITDFCDQNTLTPRARLELFVPVCQAVQHAHQKGIIHRDLKPSNVLVTLHDGTPVAKVIDFGIAKALGQRLTDKSLYTGFAQMIGTPMYMSPEQAALSGLDVDTRSDIYSLGVLLYELLTGTTPFDKERLRQAAYDEMRRIIREEEPPKPSTRISTLGQTATAVSERRRSDPRRLSQLCRGELDWIVMKALEKDRNHRYETAGAFAADVQLYLHDEPVQACPPSTLYRFRKFARRYRAALTTAALVLLALVAGVVFSAWQAIRARQARDEVRVQRDEAEANFRKACQAVDDQFTLVSQSKLFEAPGLQALRKDLLESALKYYQDFLRQRPDDAVLQAEVAASYVRLHHVYEAIDGSWTSDSVGALERGVEIVEKLLREHPQDTGLALCLAGSAKGSRALHTIYSGRLPPADPLAALPVYERAARIWERFARENPAAAAFRFDLAVLYGDISMIQADAGGPDAALPTLRKAQGILEGLAREQPKVPDYRSELDGIHFSQANILWDEGPPEEVEKHLRRSLQLTKELAADYPAVPAYRHALAGDYDVLAAWLADAGRLTEAEQAYRQALPLREKLVREFPDMPAYREELAQHHDRWGEYLRRTGRVSEADEAHRQALAIWERLAKNFPDVPEYPNILGWQLAIWPDPKFRDPGRAVELAEQALKLAGGTGQIWNTLGIAYYRAGKWKSTIEALTRSNELLEWQDVSNMFFLAMAHWQLGEKEPARKWYGLAVEWLKKHDKFRYPRHTHLDNEDRRQENRHFRAEAAALLGIEDQPLGEKKEKPPAQAPGR